MPYLDPERDIGGFALIPLRAISDKDLTAADWRVFNAIAFHDRAGRNGMPCMVSQDKIAEITRAERHAVSRSISKLISRGYVSSDTSEKDRRRKYYHVIYDNDVQHDN